MTHLSPRFGLASLSLVGLVGLAAGCELIVSIDREKIPTPTGPSGSTSSGGGQGGDGGQG
ncbi:MAG: hypothetical protein FJ096_13155, partial [Deltaproteobacteria bacterium]|nr:hypothetical protein [Deltaproteobacteria bacterium]